AALDHLGTIGAERVAEPARGLELDQGGKARTHRLVGTLGPVLGGVRPVPGGGVDEAKRGRALGKDRRKGKRHHAAHRCAGDERRGPADVVHELVEILGEQLDRIGASGLVGGAVAAAVVGQDGGLAHQTLCDRPPELAIHGNRMDQDRAILRIRVAVEGIADTRPVTGWRQIGTHFGPSLCLVGQIVADPVGAVKRGQLAPRSVATRSPNALVPSRPPRSRVRDDGSAIAWSSAASIASAASMRRLSRRRSPSQASSIAAEPISDAGLARSCPAMSGADPCCACATAWSVPALSEAASPRLPAISEARSDRMSPNMLVVTMTSNGLASRTSSAVMASTMRSSYSTAG